MVGESLDIYRQSGVLPYRILNGRLQLLLVSTRSGKWTIPKGIVEADISPAQSALKEAFEEAGLRGRLFEPSIGGFRYDKWGGICRVEIFLLEVTESVPTWPEDSFRHRRWVDAAAAAAMVKHEELRRLLEGIEPIIRAQHLTHPA